MMATQTFPSCLSDKPGFSRSAALMASRRALTSPFDLDMALFPDGRAFVFDRLLAGRHQLFERADSRLPGNEFVLFKPPQSFGCQNLFVQQNVKLKGADDARPHIGFDGNLVGKPGMEFRAIPFLRIEP
jgi:hypothetical protein